MPIREEDRGPVAGPAPAPLTGRVDQLLDLCLGQILPLPIGRYCGRRAAILYCAGELFACRRCYGLSYASQQQTALHRGLEQARKIRMRLGGGDDLLEPFPGRPKGMHRLALQRQGSSQPADAGSDDNDAAVAQCR